jgi:membrane protein DedA with SNARE-associated domain
MNLSFPHLNIPLLKFAFTVFIGIAPWNFFSCSAGAILRELTNTKEIMDTKKYLILIALALCFLLIPFIKSKFGSKKSEEFQPVKIN